MNSKDRQAVRDWLAPQSKRIADRFMVAFGPKPRGPRSSLTQVHINAVTADRVRLGSLKSALIENGVSSATWHRRMRAMR